MIRFLFVCVTASLFASAAFAHVTIETKQAEIGASYKAVFRVPHGCDGSATTAIRVKIPAGIIAVKPMPKPGWTLDIVTGKYPKAYKYFDSQLTEGVSEVSWSGGKLLDAHYDEFVFRGYLASDLALGTTIFFPVVQECEKGVHRWIEIPVEGKPEPAEPAPGVKLISASETKESHGAFKAGALTIENPWMRATPHGASVAGAYLTIKNTGSEPDRLIGGTIDGAKRFEVHEMSMTGDIMKMRPLPDGLAIKPGETVELKPGGFHIMGLDLRGGFSEGETVKGSLKFQKAGTVPIEYHVGAIGAPTQAHNH